MSGDIFLIYGFCGGCGAGEIAVGKTPGWGAGATEGGGGSTTPAAWCGNGKRATITPHAI